MRFGQWITNNNVAPVSHIKPWLYKEDGSLARWGYFAFDRRGTDLDDEGGLVSFRKRFTMGKAKSAVLRITALGVKRGMVWLIYAKNMTGAQVNELCTDKR